MTVSIEQIDEELLNIIIKKQWSFLREDFLEDFLKRFGIKVEQWEYLTKAFYLAGTIKLKDGREVRIWKPTGSLLQLIPDDEDTTI